MERWFDTYNRQRDDFDSIQEFVDWYNGILMSLRLQSRLSTGDAMISSLVTLF